MALSSRLLRALDTAHNSPSAASSPRDLHAGRAHPPRPHHVSQRPARSSDALPLVLSLCCLVLSQLQSLHTKPQQWVSVGQGWVGEWVGQGWVGGWVTRCQRGQPKWMGEGMGKKGVGGYCTNRS